jgi:hypothetical protein
MVTAMLALTAVALLACAALVRRELQQINVDPGRVAAPCGGSDDPREWLIALNPTPPTLQLVKS